ncbi:MAG: HEAT repeat domain-containing protein [Planctomycetes bacterium]|nr:HEAT repeat domain-containing protein [Planctomycetota bacterium]
MQGTTGVRSRGRRAAWVAAGAGVIVVLAGTPVLKRWVEEEWWIHELDSEDGDARKRAAERLGEMRSWRAVPHLVDRMEVGALKRIGPGAVAALLRQVSLAAFSEEDEPALLECAREADPLVRRRALLALPAGRGVSEAAFRALLGALGDADGEVRLAAARRLLETHPDLRVARRALAGLARDAAEPVRIEAAGLLAATRRRSSETAEVFLEALEDPVAAVRIAASRWIGEHASSAKAAEALSRLLEDPDPLVTEVAASALRKVASVLPPPVTPAIAGAAPPSGAALPELLTQLRDHAETKALRREAARDIGRVAAGSEEAFAALLGVLADGSDDAGVRGAAAEALAAGGFPLSRTLDVFRGLLFRSLLDEKRALQEGLFAALAELGPRARLLAPPLREYVGERRDSPAGRWFAARALWRITRDATQVVPVLVEDLARLTLEDKKAIEGICALLGDIGAGIEAAAPILSRLIGEEGLDGAVAPTLAAADPLDLALRRTLEDWLDGLRRPDDVARVLAVLGKHGMDRYVLRRLRGGDIRESLWILGVLSRMGPAAAEAVPALESLLGDRDEALRLEAEEVLHCVQGR